MAVTAKAYGLGSLDLVKQSVDWLNDTIKAAVVTSSYTPNQDTDHFWSTPQANEASGTGYSAGGITLGTKTATYDATTKQVRLDAADISWSGASFSGRYLVIYKSTGTAGTSAILGYIDFGATLTVTAGTFTIQFDASGVIVATLT